MLTWSLRAAASGPGNGFRIVTRVLFLQSNTVIGLGVESKDEKDTISNLMNVEGLTGVYSRLAGLPMIETSLSKTIEIQEAFEKKWRQRDEVLKTIQDLREQSQSIQHSMRMYNKLDVNFLANTKKIVDLAEQETDEKNKFDALDGQCRVLLAQQNANLKYTHDLHSKVHWLWLRYFAWILSIVLTGSLSLYQLSQTGEKAVLLTKIDSIKDLLETQQDQKKSAGGSSLYDWAAWTVRPLKRLKFW